MLRYFLSTSYDDINGCLHTKDSRRIQTINLSMWSLALILALLVFDFQLKDKGFYLWGLWLYLVLAMGALIVEMIIWKVKG